MSDCWEDDFNPRDRDKDPTEVLDYKVNWNPDTDELPTGEGPWLAVGEVIATSNWFVTGPDDALTMSGPDHDTTEAVVTLSGGTLGAVYELKNVITTNQSRTGARTQIITIKNR